MNNNISRAKMITQYFIIKDTINIDRDSQAFAVVGSFREIGCWNPNRCVIATQSQTSLHTWVAMVKLPAHSFFEWKWIIVSRDGSRVFKWEERDNQKSVSGKSDGCFENSWNESTHYETGLSLVDDLLMPTTGTTHTMEPPKTTIPNTVAVVKVASSKPLAPNDDKVTIGEHAPSTIADARITKQVPPSVKIITTDKKVRPDVKTVPSNKQVTSIASADERAMTNKTVDFKNKDTLKTDITNANEGMKLNIANSTHTSDSINHSSEVALVKKAHKVVMKTSKVSKSQETSQTARIAVSNSSTPETAEQSVSTKNSVPRVTNSDQIKTYPNEVLPFNERDKVDLGTSVFERIEGNGNWTESRMPICDIMQQEVNTSVKSPICDNYEKPVHEAEKKSEIFDLVQREKKSVSLSSPVIETFEKRIEHTSETVPVHKKLDNTEITEPGNTLNKDNMKFPETEDSDPILASTDAEPAKESKPEAESTEKGECGSFLSRFLDWACIIL